MRKRYENNYIYTRYKITQTQNLNWVLIIKKYSRLRAYKYKASQTKLPGPVVTFEPGIFIYDA